MPIINEEQPRNVLFLKLLTYLIIFVSFFGSYLGIPGNENLFMFRLLIPLHLILWFVFGNNAKFNISDSHHFVVLYGTYFVSMTLTLFWTPDLVASIRYLYFIFEWLYIFLICSHFIRTLGDFRAVSKMIVVVYGGMLSLGLFENITGYHLPLSGSLYYQTSTSLFEPTAFMFNTNDFASVLTMFYPICIGYVTGLKKKGWQKILMALYTFLTLYLVLQTNSRVSMAVIGIEVTLFLLNWSVIWTFLGAYLSILTGLIYESLFNLNNNPMLFSAITRAFTDKSASNLGRLEMYKSTIQIIEQSRFLGLGAGMLSEKLSVYMYGFQKVGDDYWAPHNYWLESLANGGLLVAAILGLFFINYFIKSVKICFKKKTGILHMLPIMLGLSFVSASIGLSSTIDKRHLAIGFGLGISLITILEKEA